jgi:hypothetical protein
MDDEGVAAAAEVSGVVDTDVFCMAIFTPFSTDYV